jgi:ABC-type antimicrobial peptide transport system permease subunit
MIDDVRRAVRAEDPEIAASSVRTLDDVLAASLGARRAAVQLLELFGEIAMLVAAVGVYAIAAFSAEARVRELAIRSAFGATERDLIALVVSTEYPVVCMGIAGGLAAALVVAPALGRAVFSVSVWEPGTYVSVGLLLSATTFVAAWVPAMRACRVDPAELLRS